MRIASLGSSPTAPVLAYRRKSCAQCAFKNTSRHRPLCPLLHQILVRMVPAWQDRRRCRCFASHPRPSPRQNPHSPRHRHRATSRRDFVPWRFSAAGHLSAWIGHHPGGRKPAQSRPFGGAAKSYSITSSAVASSDGGTSIPSVRAVLRLMMKPSRVGCCIGISAGFSPRNMRAA